MFSKIGSKFLTSRTAAVEKSSNLTIRNELLVYQELLTRCSKCCVWRLPLDHQCGVAREGDRGTSTCRYCVHLIGKSQLFAVCPIRKVAGHRHFSVDLFFHFLAAIRFYASRRTKRRRPDEFRQRGQSRRPGTWPTGGRVGPFA